MITIINSEDKIVEIGDNGGGQYFLDVNGTFPSNSKVEVLISFDGTNYSKLTTAVGVNLIISADYNAVVTLPASCFVKFDGTSLGSTGVTAQLVKV